MAVIWKSIIRGVNMKKSEIEIGRYEFDALVPDDELEEAVFLAEQALLREQIERKVDGWSCDVQVGHEMEDGRFYGYLKETGSDPLVWEEGKVIEFWLGLDGAGSFSLWWRCQELGQQNRDYPPVLA
jgi:hypothetical protein